MAPATIKELDRITAIRPDLETYCQELLTGLITGQKNVSGWDGYMADLKRLGLDELVSIYQARINRAKK
jgi:putative aldouronate transport system substrate-binding protein